MKIYEMITFDKIPDEKRKKNYKQSKISDSKWLVYEKRASLGDVHLFLFEPVGPFKALRRSAVFKARGRTFVGISANFNTV